MTVEQVKVIEVERRYRLIAPFLDERQRRLWAGTEAASLGHGGVECVARATKLAIKTVRRGRNEVNDPQSASVSPDSSSVRTSGAGRPRLEEQHPEILKALLDLVEPTVRGDPESPLRWTCKSSYNLAEELCAKGFEVSSTTVQRLLSDQEFSLQGLRKANEGKGHPDRDDQFQYIYKKVKSYQKRKQPVVSVDAKKKELIGDFPNGGREYRKKGNPQRVEAYSFPSMAKGKAAPYGVYDQGANEGWVTVGMSADTAEFAVSTIRTWWDRMGKPRYKGANELLITADCGGSNGYRARLWKARLQDFADTSGVSVRVMHYPPGTSKWNKIEHRLFNHITMNWRGRTLSSFEIVVECIGNTTTTTGLNVEAQLDQKDYLKGIKISDEEMESLNIKRDKFHGEWNYILTPRI